MKKLLIALLLLCLSCNDETDCTTALPSPINFFLEFQDADGNTLIGNVYAQDSFKLSAPNSIQYLKPAIGFGASHLLLIGNDQLENNIDHYLELSPTDTHTLNVEHDISNGPCFNLPFVTKLTYNQEVLFDLNNSSPSETYIIIKED